jgi:hypothetical protein
MNMNRFVTFQVLTAGSMKITDFCDTALCSFIEVDRRFRDLYCLHHVLGLFVDLVMEAERTSETSV